MSKHSALNTFGRSGNPAFTRNFENAETFSQTERMTLDGAVNKTAILLGLCFAGAFAGWNVPALAMPGLIIGTILAFVTIFRNPAKAGSTAPFYAAFEGMALGGITVFAETQYPGIGIQAIGLTFGILASLLFCYKSGLIKPTENFRLMLFFCNYGDSTSLFSELYHVILWLWNWLHSLKWIIWNWVLVICCWHCSTKSCLRF